MTDDSLIEKLLDEWQERVQTGRPADLTEICSEHPQLLPAVKEKAAAFAAMDRALRTGQTTVTIPGISDTSDGNSSAVAKGTFRVDARSTALSGCSFSCQRRTRRGSCCTR